MARKTRSQPNKRNHRTRRRFRYTSNPESVRILKIIPEPEPAPVPAPAPAPAVESHRFISSMTYDGKTLVTKTQKNNEPVKERIYTMNQLEQELPIGKELIDLHLDGKMPQGLQERHRKHMKPMFQNVLLHPADLGLLPPKVDDNIPYKHHNLETRRQRRREGRELRLQRQRPPRSTRRRLIHDNLDLMDGADYDTVYG